MKVTSSGKFQRLNMALINKPSRQKKNITNVIVASLFFIINT